ncbi:MAG: hypothetical protein EOP83_31755 [Verrucomicrobiaceae bacterium]|nr:MAG: hypothetical protein EOP83_31755 [Verrucomicrobiaceae bacterium]
MTRPLRTVYAPTPTSGHLDEFVRPRVFEFPHAVKVHEVWHTEIVIALREWITQYGGVENKDYIRGSMTQFYFHDIAFAIAFMMQFNGVESGTLVTR